MCESTALQCQQCDKHKASCRGQVGTFDPGLCPDIPCAKCAECEQGCKQSRFRLEECRKDDGCYYNGGETYVLHAAQKKFHETAGQAKFNNGPQRYRMEIDFNEKKYPWLGNDLDMAEVHVEPVEDPEGEWVRYHIGGYVMGIDLATGPDCTVTGRHLEDCTFQILSVSPKREALDKLRETIEKGEIKFPVPAPSFLGELRKIRPMGVTLSTREEAYVMLCRNGIEIKCKGCPLFVDAGRGDCDRSRRDKIFNRIMERTMQFLNKDRQGPPAPVLLSTRKEVFALYCYMECRDVLACEADECPFFENGACNGGWKEEIEKIKARCLRFLGK